MSKSIAIVIGAETRADDGSPLDALIDFYQSFSSRDLDGSPLIGRTGTRRARTTL
jgi:hypothetical protein